MDGALKDRINERTRNIYGSITFTAAMGEGKHREILNFGLHLLTLVSIELWVG